MTRDNDSAAVAELDRLDEAVRSAPAGDTSAQIALWRQTVRLGTWFFIARGSEAQPRPSAVAADLGPLICLERRAARGAAAAPGPAAPPRGRVSPRRGGHGSPSVGTGA